MHTNAYRTRTYRKAADKASNAQGYIVLCVGLLRTITAYLPHARTAEQAKGQARAKYPGAHSYIAEE